MTKNTYTAILEIEVPKELGWIRSEKAEEYLKENVIHQLKNNNLNFRSSYDTRGKPKWLKILQEKRKYE
jgi:hypothetical protein